MPNDILELDLEDVIMSNWKKGSLLRPIDWEKEEGDIIHYKIKNIRNLMKNIYKLYSKKKHPSREDFVQLWNNTQYKNDREIMDFLDQLDRPQPLLQIIEKKENDKEMIIKFKKVDDSDRCKLIQKLARKLLKKMDKNQLSSLLEEGLRKNKYDVLKKVEKKLEKKKVEVKSNKGCFMITVDDIVLSIIR